MKRYLMVVGIILAVIVVLGVCLKPSLSAMRDGFDTGMVEYKRAKEQAGAAPPVITHETSRDWLVAVSHGATVDGRAYSCFGAFKVTICTTPDADDAAETAQ